MPSVILTDLSSMLFDKPAAEKYLMSNIIYFIFLSYPFVLILSVSGSVISYRSDRWRLNLLFSLAPFVNIVLAVLVFIAAAISTM